MTSEPVVRRLTCGRFVATPEIGHQHAKAEAPLADGGDVTLVFEGVPPSLEAEGYDVAVEVVALTTQPVRIWHVPLPDFNDVEAVVMACRVALVCVGVDAAELSAETIREALL